MKAARLILLALTSLPLLNSCQGTEELKGITVDNRIGIEVGSGIFTKSGKTTSSENLFSIPFVTDSGETMYINAVLSDYDMNPVFLQGGPLTKGAAVTTSNIGSLPGYETFNMSVYHKGAIYKSHEDEMKNLQVRKTGMGESSRWELPGTYFWPTGYDMLTPLFFCAWAPAAAFTPESEVPYAGSVSDLSWTCDVEGRAKATFSYTLPASATDGEDESGSVYQDAANQPDLVFAVNPQTSKDHVIDGKSYAQITFGHALTAVRFVRGTLRNCILNRIALEGFHSSGDCEYSYDSATEGYQFKWTGLGELKSYTQTFDRTVDNSIKSTSDEGMGDYFDPTDQSSYTFMMIPQELDQTAVIKIYLDGRLHPMELLLGALTTKDVGGDTDEEKQANLNLLKDWSTYAGKVINLSVNSTPLDDAALITTFSESGNTLSEPSVTNIGKNSVYVRATKIANWTNEDGSKILAPYVINGSIADHSDLFILPTEAIEKEETKPAQWSDYWYYNESDGFYYYKYKLSRHQGHDHSLSMPLFKSFTAPAPASGIARVDGLSKLKMTILYQCIDAISPAGSGRTDGKDGVLYAGWITTGSETWLSTEEKGKCVLP